MAGTDTRTPEQKDAEGLAALEQLLTRAGLFGWGPVTQTAVPALAEAVTEHTATGRVSRAVAKRVGVAVEKVLCGLGPEASAE